MPTFFQVTLNGHPIKCRMEKREAEAMAERWQGSHARNLGLLKHKDRGDHVEVSVDHDSGRDFDRSYDAMKRGHDQDMQFIDK